MSFEVVGLFGRLGGNSGQQTHSRRRSKKTHALDSTSLQPDPSTWRTRRGSPRAPIFLRATHDGTPPQERRARRSRRGVSKNASGLAARARRLGSALHRKISPRSDVRSRDKSALVLAEPCRTTSPSDTFGRAMPPPRALLLLTLSLAVVPARAQAAPSGRTTARLEYTRKPGAESCLDESGLRIEVARRSG